MDSETGTRNPEMNSRVKQYHERGYADPFSVCSKEEIAEHRSNIETEVLEGGKSPILDRPPQYYRHLDVPGVHSLLTHPNLVNQITNIYSPNVLLWSSKIWNKPPNGAEVPWHQNVHHMPLDPAVCMTGWLALEEVTEENGCLQVIPNSNDRVIPEVDSPADKSFNHMCDPEKVNEEECVSIELQPGECVLFDERIVHRSLPNQSDGRRFGMSFRVTHPFVNIETESLAGEESELDSTAIVLSGENNRDTNETTEVRL